jgi:deoxyribose-phosphate aldolase
MKLNSSAIARMVDISVVQAPHGTAEIDVLVESAVRYNFVALHVLPSWVPVIRNKMIEAGIYDDAGFRSTAERFSLIGSPVGFPSGGNTLAVKKEEARQLLKDGVQEMDMMINVGRLKSGDSGYVADEIKSIVEINGEMPVKVILEIHHLTDDELKKGCELCIENGAAFIKTSTGWAPSGATLEKVKFITTFVGKSIQVKAAGGIRNIETLIEMYKMGVRRFGVNLKSSIEIVEECAALPGGVIEV